MDQVSIATSSRLLEIRIKRLQSQADAAAAAAEDASLPQDERNEWSASIIELLL